MSILSRKIGRLPFALVSILLYFSVPFYYAAWEYETVSSYVMEPTGLIMGLFAILGSGIPFCFAHQDGVLASLEFTAPFALLLLLATLWLGRMFKKQIGGYTGDCLGATQQLSEVAFYCGMLCKFS